MYAVISENLYWYQHFRGKTIVLARNGQPVDESFQKKGGIFQKIVNINDPEIKDIYNVKYYVEYSDNTVKDTIIWQIGDGFHVDRPYNIEKGEACIGVFGAVSVGGWNTNGRDESHKIIRLSDCTKFFVEYSYEKIDFILCSEPVIERVELSMENLIEAVKKHRV